MEFAAASPIWAQLVSEFSRRIALGEWPPGARIPGVRDLAAEVGVNPNTAQRALAELDRLGLSFSERTSGRFVTSDHDRITALRGELAAAATDTYLVQARNLGLSLAQALDLVRTRWESSEPLPPSGDNT